MRKKGQTRYISHRGRAFTLLDYHAHCALHCFWRASLCTSHILMNWRSVLIAKGESERGLWRLERVEVRVARAAGWRAKEEQRGEVRLEGCHFVRYYAERLVL